MSDLLFSYGTLQQPEVQQAVFGRLVEGQPDSLPGYRTTALEITDPEVLATSGVAVHQIAVPTGDPADEVAGMVFTITQAELAAADDYEVSDYARVSTRLKSGRAAWVYVKP